MWAEFCSQSVKKQITVGSFKECEFQKQLILTIELELGLKGHDLSNPMTAILFRLRKWVFDYVVKSWTINQWRPTGGSAIVLHYSSAL